MKNKKFWWAITVIWCAFIFYNSSKAGAESNQSSNYVMFLINEYIAKIFGEHKFEATSLIIRKGAHLTEYFILAIFSSNSFYSKRFGVKSFINSMLFCIIYSISDEIHQYFIPGREGKVFDVMIDTCGSLLGSLVCYTFHKYKIAKEHSE